MAGWVARIVGALAILGFGWFAVTATVANTLRGDGAATAHRLAPWDGRATANLATRTFLLGVRDPDQRAAGIALAHRALVQDPTALGAVTTLGLAAQLGERMDRADRLLGYSQRLSRRDLTTQVWAVENAKARGDVPATLERYDAMFRTAPDARALYFPALAATLTDPRAADGLVRVLAARPNWGDEFLRALVAQPVNVGVQARVLTRLAGRGVPIDQGVSAALIDAALRADRPDDAWRVYAAVRPGVARSTSRDRRFAAVMVVPTAFDWVPAVLPGVSASLGSDGAIGSFDYSAAPSVGGAVLSQRQVLPRGRYRLTGRSQAIEQAGASLPFWVLACADGRELGRVAVPPSATAQGRFAGEVTVPAGCPSQVLALIVQPSDSIGGASGQILEAGLSPAS